MKKNELVLGIRNNLTKEIMIQLVKHPELLTPLAINNLTKYILELEREVFKEE